MKNKTVLVIMDNFKWYLCIQRMKWNNTERGEGGGREGGILKH